MHINLVTVKPCTVHKLQKKNAHSFAAHDLKWVPDKRLEIVNETIGVIAEFRVHFGPFIYYYLAAREMKKKLKSELDHGHKRHVDYEAIHHNNN